MGSNSEDFDRDQYNSAFKLIFLEFWKILIFLEQFEVDLDLDLDQASAYHMNITGFIDNKPDDDLEARSRSSSIFRSSDCLIPLTKIILLINQVVIGR